MKETWLDQIGKSEYIANARRFLIGVCLAASTLPEAATWKSVAFIATGIVGTSLSTAQAYLERRTKQKDLAAFYKEELSALHGKTPEQVTAEDVHRAALPAERGGDNIQAFKTQLADYKYEQNFRIGVSFASSLITCGLLVAAAASDIHTALPTVVQLGLVGIGYMAIRNMVQSTGELILGKPEEHTVCHRLMHLAEQVKTRTLQPSEIFSVFTEARPELQAEITRKHGKPFEHLTLAQKNDVVDKYEPVLRIARLTEAVNRGELQPGIISFIAYEQGAEQLPEYKRYEAMFREPVHMPCKDAHSPLEKPYRHVKRLQEQRLAQETIFPSPFLQ